MHGPDELKHEIADQVAGLLWSTPADEKADPRAKRIDLTDGQKAAIRLIASALRLLAAANRTVLDKSRLRVPT
jgi:hypothetical protein